MNSEALRSASHGESVITTVDQTKQGRERLSKEWYVENLDLIESARQELLLSGQEALTEIEAKLDQIFATLGIASADYSFQYAEDELREGKFGVFVRVENVKRQEGAPEFQYLGKSKKEGKMLLVNYSQLLTEHLCEALQLAQIDTPVKAIAYSRHEFEPVTIDSLPETRANPAIKLAIVDQPESRLRGLVSREQLKSHALDSEVQLFKRVNTLVGAAERVSVAGGSSDQNNSETQVVRYLAKNLASELRTRLQQIGGTESDLTRIPSTAEMEAVAKVKKYVKENPAAVFNSFEELCNAVNLSDGDTIGIERILFKLEKFSTTPPYVAQDVLDVVLPYASGGEYEYRYTNLSILARLVLPAGTSLGGQRATGLFPSGEESFTPMSVAHSLEQAILQFIQTEERNPTLKVLLSKSGLGIKIPRNADDTFNVNAIQAYLNQIPPEKKRTPEQVQMIRERIKTEVSNKVEHIEADVNMVARQVDAINSNLTKQGFEAIQNVDETGLQALSEKVLTIAIKHTEALNAILEIKSTLQTTELEMYAPEFERLLQQLVTQLEILSTRSEGLKTELNFFNALRESSDDLTVTVSVGEHTSAAQLHAALHTSRAQRASTERTSTAVQEIALYNEFAFFANEQEVLRANELYLLCFEKVIECGWAEAQAEISAFSVFATQHLKNPELEAVLQHVNILQNLVDINLNPGDYGRSLAELAREHIGRLKQMVSIPKSIELVLSWTVVVLISKKLNVLISQYGPVDHELLVHGLQWGGLVGAGMLATVDANAKADFVEQVSTVSPKRRTVPRKSVLGVLTIGGMTAFVGDAVQEQQLQMVSTQLQVDTSRGAALETRSSLETAEATSSAYLERYNRALELYTVGVIITETGLGTDSIDSISEELVSLGFYNDVTDITYGTVGRPGVGTLTLTKIYALLGSIPEYIEIDDVIRFELRTRDAETYREVFDRLYTNDAVFAQTIDRIDDRRKSLNLDFNEALSGEVTTQYQSFLEQNTRERIEEPLDRYFDAVDKIESLKSLRARILAIFLNGETPNSHDLENYAHQTNTSIDEAIVEFEILAQTIQSIQTDMSSILTEIDENIQMPALDQGRFVPELKHLVAENLPEMEEEISAHQAIIDMVTPDIRTARLIAQYEALNRAPDDPRKQLEIVEEIAAWNVSTSLGKGFLLALAPLLALSLPAAVFLARRKRKNARESIPRYEQALEQQSRKLSSLMNIMLSAQGFQDQFPPIEPYMVHRVLLELASEMDTRGLGIYEDDIGTDEDSPVSVYEQVKNASASWLYSLVDSIQDDTDTLAASAACRINQKAQKTSPEETGLAVFVLDRLIPGYTERLREAARNNKSGEVASAFESKVVASHYERRIELIQGRTQALRAQQRSFSEDESRFANLQSGGQSSELAREMAGEELRYILATERALADAEQELRTAMQQLAEHSVDTGMKTGNRGRFTVPNEKSFTFQEHPLSVKAGMIKDAETEIQTLLRTNTIPSGKECLEKYQLLFVKAQETVDSLKTQYAPLLIKCDPTFYNSALRSPAVNIHIRPESATSSTPPLHLTIPVSLQETSDSIEKLIVSAVGKGIAYEHAVQTEIDDLKINLQSKCPKFETSFSTAGLYVKNKKYITFTITDSRTGEPIVKDQVLTLEASSQGEAVSSQMENSVDKTLVARLIRAKVEDLVTKLVEAHRVLELASGQVSMEFSKHHAEYLLSPEFEIVESSNGYSAVLTTKVLESSGSAPVFSETQTISLTNSNGLDGADVQTTIVRSVANFLEKVRLPRVLQAVSLEFPDLLNFNESKNNSKFIISDKRDIDSAKFLSLYEHETLRLKRASVKRFVEILHNASSIKSNTTLSNLSTLLPDNLVMRVVEQITQLRDTEPASLPSVEFIKQYVDDLFTTARLNPEIDNVSIEVSFVDDPDKHTFKKRMLLTIVTEFADTDQRPTTQIIPITQLR